MLDPSLPLRAQLGVEHNWMILFEPSTLHLINEDERIVRKAFFKSEDGGGENFGLLMSHS